MMNRFNSFLFTTILFFSHVSPGTARYRKDGNPSSRNIVVQNRAGCKIDFFWIHPQTKELAGSNTDGGLVNGGDSSINSYVTHSFEVQELPSKKTGTCKEEECRKAYFTVSANEDQSKSPMEIKYVYIYIYIFRTRSLILFVIQFSLWTRTLS
jgi:hypothetical protein